MARITIGRIRQLWRYPVKSMAGELLEQASVDPSGIIGDRKWAPWDVLAGELTNCKVVPSLLACAARYTQAPQAGFAVSHAELMLPDTRGIRTDDPFLDAVLSAIAGRPLTLCSLRPASDAEHYRIQRPLTPEVIRQRMGLPPDDPDPDFSVYEPEMLEELQHFATPRGSYKDAYPLHLMTTASLASVAELAPGIDTNPRRFRPNILIETDGLSGFPENDWQGFDLIVGDVILHCGPKTVRCSMPAQPQYNVAAEPRMGAVLRRHTGMNLGGYAYVRRPGTIRVGDRVALEVKPERPRLRPNFPAIEPARGGVDMGRQPLLRGAFSSMRVVARRQETDDVVSITLRGEPPAGPGFLPGQHLLFRLQLPGTPKPLLRSYSISSAPDRLSAGEYRITVKRMGAASAYLHDRVTVGDVLDARAPFGRYFLLPTSPRPLVLVSNGIGVTPLLSMLGSVASNKPERTIFWVHATRDGGSHVFRDAVAEIAEKLPNFSSLVVYREPRACDVKGRDYHSTRYLEPEDLAPLAEMRNAEMFLCGTPAFMDQVKSLATGHGIDARHIYVESFGARSVRTANAGAAERDIEPKHIRFERSGLESEWVAGEQTLLELAEELGIAVDYGCRFGACQACSANLLKGDVRYSEPDIAAGEGRVLLCCAEPTSDLVLDL